MRLSIPLLRQAYRITLFTRPQCGLCDEAKEVLDQVKGIRSFEAHEIDISSTAARPWRDQYGLDVPVIHLSKAESVTEDPAKSRGAVKLMHRFTVEEVLRKMDQVESKTGEADGRTTS